MAFGKQKDQKDRGKNQQNRDGRDSGNQQHEEQSRDAHQEQGHDRTAHAQHVQTSESQVRVPVVEEEIAVGKRAVETGGVRVQKEVTEQPVAETVHLHEERVTVERYPVDRPANEADFHAFDNQTVEIREISEEPVIEKRARVVEEIVVGKETTQRTAQISDTIRRTDVHIVPLQPGEYRTASGYRGTYASGGRGYGGGHDPSDRYFREHYRQRFASTGSWDYDNGYSQAYRYGQELARYSNDWGSIKDEVRRQWNQRNPRAPWDQFRDAIRYGFDWGRRA